MLPFFCTLLIALNPLLSWTLRPVHLLAQALPALTASCTPWGAVLTATVAAEASRKTSVSKVAASKTAESKAESDSEPESESESELNSEPTSETADPKSKAKPKSKLKSLADSAESAAHAEASGSTDKPRVRRLPRYYSQLGLSDEQRKEIDKLGERYGARLQRLRDQLDELQQERDEQYRAVLTDEQRQQLSELQPPSSE